jgi:putative tricarboxylic transport membrane protein
MTSYIKNPKDFWTGIMYVGMGGAALMLSQNYTMGSTLRMGPGYFPTVLGSLLALVGLASIVRSVIKPGEQIAAFAWRGLALALGSVVLFGILVRGAGLAPAVVLMVLMSAFAHEKFKLVPSIVLAIGMALFSVLVFIKGLGVPLRILGTWFGN